MMIPLSIDEGAKSLSGDAKAQDYYPSFEGENGL